MSEIRVDNITDEAGTGSPSLPNGLVTPSATVSGTLDVASNIQLDSNGISFDSGSNYLDDYEEGTFTPLIGDSAGNTISISSGGNNSGSYIKIGSLVKVSVAFDVRPGYDVSGVNLSSKAHFRNLPFVTDGSYGLVSWASRNIPGLPTNYNLPSNLFDIGATNNFTRIGQSTNAGTSWRSPNINELIDSNSGSSQFFFSFNYKTTE